MSFIIRSHFSLEPLSIFNQLSLRFFMVEGGKHQGFMNEQELENQADLAFELADAKIYKNLIVARNKDLFSGDLLKLTNSKEVFKEARFHIQCSPKGKQSDYFFGFFMKDVTISSMGVGHLGASGAVERYKLNFSDAEITNGGVMKLN